MPDFVSLPLGIRVFGSFKPISVISESQPAVRELHCVRTLHNKVSLNTDKYWKMSGTREQRLLSCPVSWAKLEPYYSFLPAQPGWQPDLHSYNDSGHFHERLGDGRSTRQVGLTHGISEFLSGPLFAPNVSNLHMLSQTLNFFLGYVKPCFRGV